MLSKTTLSSYLNRLMVVAEQRKQINIKQLERLVLRGMKQSVWYPVKQSLSQSNTDPTDHKGRFINNLSSRQWTQYFLCKIQSTRKFGTTCKKSLNPLYKTGTLLILGLLQTPVCLVLISIISWETWLVIGDYDNLQHLTKSYFPNLAGYQSQYQ